ncbi:DUF4082 domain-containing protein [Pelotalea chapellei]|uniref:DUF4082 domain-containing protein n=1 Tax=Pelotalea chapellei TaxID=44671 RepID=A0ABS5U5X9_9BACT|nr:DUF4082 domain-containing protein [Pelotalea chapellei]MBT1071064.1 DUF4082 domain-containing protein [Pelotalea chapellei]
MKRGIIACVAIGFCLLTGIPVFASPAIPVPVDATQPDTTRFKVRIRGDERQHWLELAETGHAIIQNKKSSLWEYAEPTSEGIFVPSGIKVEPKGNNAPPSIPKGFKPPQKTAVDVAELSPQQDMLAVPSASSWSHVFGIRKVLVVLVNFADRSFITSANDWHNLLFSTTPGMKSMVNFFYENSSANVTISPASHTQPGSPAGIVSVNIADMHPYGGTSGDSATLATHILDQVAYYVDLESCDINKDGMLDGSELSIYMVYAGYEQSGSVKIPSVWAHAESGDIQSGNVRVREWALSGELNDQDVQHPVGVVVHELGHSLLGLPDLYDSSYTNAALGMFSTMAYGCWGADIGEYQGTTPVALDAWSREFLGWTIPIEPAAGSLEFPSSSSSPAASFKLSRPLVSENEYFLLENLQPSGWNKGLRSWLGSDWAGGLLILHIDSNRFNNYYFGPGEHQKVVPVEASTGFCSMLREGSTCTGHKTTLFYQGNNTDWNETTTPNSNYYSTFPSGFSMTAISAPLSTMSAIYTPPDEVLPVVTDFVLPVSVTSLTVPILTFTASDNLGITGYLVTEDPTPPLGDRPVWLVAAPTNHTFGTGGFKTLYAWARDTVGNVSLVKSATTNILFVDTTPPKMTGIFVSPTQISLDVYFSLSATDDVAVTGYYISEDPVKPLATDSGWHFFAAPYYIFNSIGTKTLYAWAKDAAGNVSENYLSATFTIVDNYPPSIYTFIVPSTASSLSVPIEIRAYDNTILGGYLVSENSTPPLAADPRWSTVTPTSYTFTTAGTKTLYAWVKDTAGNISASKSAVIVIALPITSLWPNTAVPAILAITDGVPIEVGFKFRSDVNGNLTGLRFYKGAANTGTHTANLWSREGVLLATVPFKNETASGWQEVSFPVPVPIVANKTYVASYHSSSGYYAATDWYFTRAIDNAPLHALADGTDGGNGVYKYGNSGFPSNSYNGSNYWVDVVFDATAIADTTPPVVTAFVIPATSCGLVVPIQTLTASDNVAVSGYLLTETANVPSPTAGGWSTTTPTFYAFGSAGTKILYAWAKDAAGNVSAGNSATVTISIPDVTPPTVTAFSVPANSSLLTVPVLTFTAADDTGVFAYLITESANPPLAADPRWSAATPTSYTFASAGTKTLYAWVKDTAGNISASKSAVIVIALPITSLWPNTAVPAILAITDGVPIEVGFKFRSDVNGNLTGLRFYKGAANTGTHTANLWTREGVLLATVPFKNETASGWQEVSFPVPVPIVANKTYVASYHSSSGYYAATDWYFTRAIDNAPLHALADGTDGGNGVYKYGNSGFPSNSYNGSNYWVDVVFDATAIADTTPPVVTAFVIPATSSGLVVPIQTLTASDNVAVSGYLLTETANVPSPTVGGWSTTTPTSYAFGSAGAKILYAWAKDAAGNVSAGNSATVTISVSAGLVMDVIVSGDVSKGGASVTTSSFSTGTSNQLLLAFVAGANPTETAPAAFVTGVSGGGLTWTLVRRTNVQHGTAEVWRAYATSRISGSRVTATFNQSVSSASVTVVSFIGADSTGTNGSGAIGATGSANSLKGAPTASLVTTRAHSWVLGVGNDWDSATARTVGPVQVLVHQYLSATQDTYWVQRMNNTTPLAGTIVTINDSAPTTDRYNLTTIEVLPSFNQQSGERGSEEAE